MESLASSGANNSFERTFILAQFLCTLTVFVVSLHPPPFPFPPPALFSSPITPAPLFRPPLPPRLPPARGFERPPRRSDPRRGDEEGGGRFASLAPPSPRALLGRLRAASPAARGHGAGRAGAGKSWEVSRGLDVMMVFSIRGGLLWCSSMLFDVCVCCFLDENLLDVELSIMGHY